MRRIGSMVAALALLWASPARAAAPPGIVVATAVAFTYVPGNDDVPSSVLDVPQGWSLEFVNMDPLGAHSITASKQNASGYPIFGSDAVNFGLSSRVDGIETLEPGTYAFTCSVHSWLMRGTLRIDPAPTLR